MRLYFDRFPDQKEKVAQFRSFLIGLNRDPQLRRAAIHIREDQIAEINSHQHDVLQCLDVVLGSMQFRLNNQHLVKLPGSNRRGKKTIAKEKLYKHILKRIGGIYPRFNIGISTGKGSSRANFWHHPYRHWLFQPQNYVVDNAQNKP